MGMRAWFGEAGNEENSWVTVVLMCVHRQVLGEARLPSQQLL